jgi:hypothetical protein
MDGRNDNFWREGEVSPSKMVASQRFVGAFVELTNGSSYFDYVHFMGPFACFQVAGYKLLYLCEA